MSEAVFSKVLAVMVRNDTNTKLGGAASVKTDCVGVSLLF